MQQATAQTRAAPELVPVKIPCIAGYWSEAWDLLEPAVARNGLYTKHAVLQALLAGDFQLWVVETGDCMTLAVITEIAEYPARKVGIVAFLGGENLAGAMPLFETIEAWARACGCDRFVNHGRPGITKHLEKRGYRLESVALVKDFTDA